MSKIVYFIILGALILAAVAAVNVNDVAAREETRFVQISVLAEDQADYGVDEILSIPAVSAEIIEDKVHDIQQDSSVPVITYTSLPKKDPKPDTQSGEEVDKEELKEEEKLAKEEQKQAKEEEKLAKEEAKQAKEDLRKDKKDKKDKKEEKPAKEK